MSAPATWDEVLSAMELELDAHEEMVRTGNLAQVPEFTAPEGLGPLPGLLADRVAHLQSRVQLLATFVRYQLIAADGDLQHLMRHPNGPTQGDVLALYLDATA